MRILVYPHDLRMGGSQLNAIELGAATQSLGHEVVLFGQPGPLADVAVSRGMEFVPAPIPGKRPSPAVISALVRTVRERRVDILHGYEWPPALECLAASKLVPGSTAVATVMSMAVAPFIPKSMPLMVGTGQIHQWEVSRGRGTVHVMEPPVDTEANQVSTTPGLDAFTRAVGLTDRVLNVVCVTRLAYELKLEGIMSAMDTVGLMSAERPVRLIIAGTGPARDEVGARAALVNAATGRETVTLTGELSDPRPAYAAADVVLGMGGSALRGLSFGKPLVVQGERGFWELLTPRSLPTFLWQGWYGSGPGTAGQGHEALGVILRGLMDDEQLRNTLGVYGRKVVEERFSLESAAPRQLRLYQDFAASRPAPASILGSELAAAARYAGYVGKRRYQRILKRLPMDDFNSRPVAMAATASTRSSEVRA
ncbi:Glycosyltransferase involved in cell wall biosynthesis [Arthrobacter sp. 9V]|uniref:glycosyltransferase family 4 protein n=1 Tax=Arthrobacter sp. 9V TaxID=2653132 RepID=UPI0012F34748|nr:glycosyltransferase family 4 protein [Arthrobacter sp. 9V]VXB29917.1 Glycosyltransferase involved in cell wall biosynthesis [Arthrobacter sp. 9V]